MPLPPPEHRVALLATLLLITLIAALPGCSTLAPTPAVSGADVSLLQPCGEPGGDAQTNAGIAAWLLAYKGALRGCNAQITTFKASAGRRSVAGGK